MSLRHTLLSYTGHSCCTCARRWPSIFNQQVCRPPIIQIPRENAHMQWRVMASRHIGALLLCMFWNQFRKNVCWDSFQFCRIAQMANISWWCHPSKNQTWGYTGANWTATSLYTKMVKQEWNIPCGLKLKRGGRKRPFGRRVLGSRSSSKNGWTSASTWRKVSKRS